MPRQEQSRVTDIALTIRNVGARSLGLSAPLFGCITPGKDLVPIIQQAGWAPGLV